MKTVRNFLGVWMLTMLVSGVTSNLQAQGRGNERRRENPGRDKTIARSDKDHSDRGRSDKDRNKDSDRNNSNRDRDHSNNDRNKDWNHDNSRDRDRNDHHDYDYNRDRHNDRNSHRDYTSRNNKYYHHGRFVTYHHHRSGYRWAPAYGYRYNTRYIYYRDYNVYYDCYRDVFVTWSGRNWIVTTAIPDVICHVDFRRASVVGVDYWDDDFDFYLARRRPSFISIQANW